VSREADTEKSTEAQGEQPATLEEIRLDASKRAILERAEGVRCAIEAEQTKSLAFLRAARLHFLTAALFEIVAQSGQDASILNSEVPASESGRDWVM
jgi:hypothetical protein